MSSAPAPQRLVDGSGRALIPSTELGRGGEGITYALTGDRSGSVLKLWHAGVQRDAEVLHEVSEIVAEGWPTPSGRVRVAAIQDIVRSEPGALVGVVIDRLPAGAVELSELLTSADRRRHGLVVTLLWQFRVAARLADVVARAHACGLVLADVGPRNVAVDPLTARTTTFDVDAWQLQTGVVEARRVAEDVAAPEHLRGEGDPAPPSQDADRASLAAAIVHILLDGRHPCDGTRVDGSERFPLVADNIRDGYSHLSSRPLLPGPGTPGLDVLSPRVRELATEAFEEGYSTPRLRPSGVAWVSALRDDAAELRPCGGSPGGSTRHHLVHPDARCLGCARRDAGLPDSYGP